MVPLLETAGSARFGITLHDGDGAIDVQWYFREQTSLPVAIHRWRIPPGGSEGMHAHPEGDAALEEIYVLLTGTAVMTVDGERIELAPGDAVLARAGTSHDIVNPGAVPADVMVVWGRPGTAPDWTRSRTGRASHAAANDGQAPTGPA